MSLRSVLFTLSLFAIGIHTPANADQTGLAVAYVTSGGNDANSCAIAAPCASISGALGKTATGGAINCISAPAGFQTIAITSSVTIDCNVGFLFGSVTINLPLNDSLSSVYLRHLSLLATATNYGVQIQAATYVILENVNIKHFSNAGVADQRSAVGYLTIKDSVFSDSAGPGIVVAGAAGTTAVLDNVVATHNRYGVAVAANNIVSIVRSTFLGNPTGVEADGGAAVHVDSSLFNRNGTAVQSGSSIRLSNCNIENSYVRAVDGATGSFGNNRFSFNVSDGTALSPAGASSTDLGEK